MCPLRHWENTLSKLIITKMDGRILTALMDDRRRAVQIDLDDGEPSLLGNIYVGKVKDVVKNLNAAFVDLGEGIVGYYSLTANPVHRFAREPGQTAKDCDPQGKEEEPDRESSGKKPPIQVLRPGDEIVVQVSRDAVKTKDPVLSASLSFMGRFAVLTADPSASRNSIRFSSRITDDGWKKQITERLLPSADPSSGLIIRTGAYGAEPEAIAAEAERLKERFHQVVETAPHRICRSLLFSEPPQYIARLRDRDAGTADEILTDDEEIFEEISDYLGREQPGNLGKLRLYRDPALPLDRLYAIRENLRDALQKRVWLKSGAYLVIEPTEAMTVIDVNTGKYTGRKTMEDTVLMINREAAAEAARQMRLRNLSGIILIDFINMDSAAYREEVMRALSECCLSDPVKTTVVDMTKLGLAEITRKKIRRPLYEQVQCGASETHDGFQKKRKTCS